MSDVELWYWTGLTGAWYVVLVSFLKAFYPDWYWERGGGCRVPSQYCVNVTGLGSIPYRAFDFFFLSSYPDLLKVSPRFPSVCVGEGFSLGIKIVGAWSWPPSIAEIKIREDIPPFPYLFSARCLVTHGGTALPWLTGCTSYFRSTVSLNPELRFVDWL
jgi:hypothetical protein